MVFFEITDETDENRDDERSKKDSRETRRQDRVDVVFFSSPSRPRFLFLISV
jgi:hypothetical protein